MKSTFISLLILLLLSSCKTVEERIKDYSYTDEWYYINDVRYQLYQTKSGRKYVIVFNKKQTKLLRKYIKSK
jgi:hypothetical protein